MHPCFVADEARKLISAMTGGRPEVTALYHDGAAQADMYAAMGRCVRGGGEAARGL